MAVTIESRDNGGKPGQKNPKDTISVINDKEGALHGDFFYRQKQSNIFLPE